MRQAFSPTGTVTRKKEHTVWPRGGQSTTTIPYNSLSFLITISDHFQLFLYNSPYKILSYD